MTQEKAERLLAEHRIHPFAKEWPMMSGEELASLAKDISEHGLIHPIVEKEGEILDGRNRFVACRMANIVPTFVEWTPRSATDSPTAWIWSVNGPRRNLTKSQQGAIAANMLPHLEAEARERRNATLKRGDKSPDVAMMPPREEWGKSREKAAAIVGVSPRYVSDAKAIKEASPETFNKVLAGEVSIPQAKKQIWDAGELAERPKEHDPEDDDSDGLWQLKQCWRKASKKEKADFLKWVEETGSKSKRK